MNSEDRTRKHVEDAKEELELVDASKEDLELKDEDAAKVAGGELPTETIHITYDHIEW